MKWPIILLLVMGVIAAFCAAVIVTAVSTRRMANPIGSGAQEATVLVAVRDLPALSVLTEADFEKRTIPVTETPEGHMSNSVQAVGQVLMVPISKGQGLTSDSFAKQGPGTYLAAKLPPGKRAVAISLANYAGMEGLLYPGAYVDVLATFDMKRGNAVEGTAVSTTMLQGVQVLAIENRAVGGNASNAVEEQVDSRVERSVSRRGRMITLLVNTRQAEALQLAMEHGTISLSLRNPTDAEDFDRDPTVLAEGRLARLAEVLEAAVMAEDDAETIDTEPTSIPLERPDLEVVVPSPAPQINTPSTEPAAELEVQPWNIHILRGADVEIRSFQPKEQPDSPQPVQAN